MAPRSIKEIIKALNGVFAGAANLQILPQDLQQTIETFLETQPKVSNDDSHRLHEELLSIWNKYVSKDETKHGVFLHALRLLRPAVRGQVQLEEWWTLLVKPTLDSIGHKKVEIENAGEFLLGILDFDADDDTDGERAKESSHFSKLLLEIYLKRSRMAAADEQSLISENQFIATQLEQVLTAFGRKKPKNFMLVVDEGVVDKQYRAQALALMCTLVQQQPAHLHLVTETPLIEHILQCLMIDSSTTAISSALTTLIMFLPHIPTFVITHLPRLFLIYSRLLCWELPFRPGTQVEESDGVQSRRQQPPANDGKSKNIVVNETWEKLPSSFDITESTAPDLMPFFTFLYGLYPLNFLSYVRNPRTYLKTIAFPRVDEFGLDQTLIRSRTEQFRCMHLLHPNFFTTTVEEELTDNRWLKSDPADVVAECISLYTPQRIEEPRPSGPPPVGRLPDIPGSSVPTEDIPQQSLLNHDDDASSVANSTISRSDTRSKISRHDRHSNTIGSPLQLALNKSQHSQEMPVAQSALHGSPTPQLQQGGNDSPVLSQIDQTLDSGGAAPRNNSTASFHSASEHSASANDQQATELQMPLSQAVHFTSNSDANLAFLKREVMLLRNNLNFERYLKQQHLSHIGQLQRRRINDATNEAQAQNLVNINRSLKAKLAKANQTYASVKSEIAASRAHSRKVEVDLSARVRTLDEEARKWKSEEEAARVELQKMTTDSNHLRRLVVETEARELLSQQKVASIELELEQLDELRKRVQELESKLRSFEARELDFERANEERQILETKLKTAELRVQSKDVDQDFLRRSYDRKIAELDFKLREALDKLDGPGQMRLEEVKHVIESTNAKYSALKKEHANLRHKVVELEMKCQELEQDAVNGLGSSSAPATLAARGSPWLPSSNVIGKDISSYAAPTNSSLEDSTAGHVPVTYEPIPTRPVRPPSFSELIGEISSSMPAAIRAPPFPFTKSDSTNSAGPLLGRSSSVRTESAGFRSLQTPVSESDRGMDSDAVSREGAAGITRSAASPYSNRTSAWSEDSLVSKDSQGSKTKVMPKDVVRVYGRGGAQNIGKTVKDEDEIKREKREKMERESKGKGGPLGMGSFRGIRGIM